VVVQLVKHQVYQVVAPRNHLVVIPNQLAMRKKVLLQSHPLQVKHLMLLFT
jgi:hypothetical protein